MQSLRIVIVAVIVAGGAFAQSGGEYEVINAATVAGGGEMQGGDYSASVSMGQVSASDQPSSGGGWTMDGGFWVVETAVPAPEPIFADGFEQFPGETK